MSDQPRPNGVIITTQEVFQEVRELHRDVRSIKQSMDELVKPKLREHDAALTAHDKTLDQLNVKFYGVLAGGVLGMLAVLADALGVFK